jgi:nucleotide-binding universal stress UspA family protein
MPDQPIRRIVVATDFSTIADGALEVAITVGRAFGARIDIVHASTPVLLMPPPFEMVPIPTLFPDLPRRIQEGLEARAARVREAGLTGETAELAGTPHIEIIRYAQEIEADLVAMGTHGHGLSHTVMGSVAERVLHHAPCLVLVVPDRQRNAHSAASRAR